MNKSSIQWLAGDDGSEGFTWNPTTGCRKVSAGCANCYASTWAARRMGQWKGREFEDVRTHADRLDGPLRRRKPARIFVNSMSDLFHDAVPEAFIDSVFAVMACAPHHRFIVLTKRPARMRDYCARLNPRFDSIEAAARELGRTLVYNEMRLTAFPSPNVILGVSVEDQRSADERIPLLLETPAAVRAVSYEPALGPVRFVQQEPPRTADGAPAWPPTKPQPARYWLAHKDWADDFDYWTARDNGIRWIIVGGESGHGARPFDVRWARSVIAQGRAAGVPVFVKQLGANVRDRNDAGFEAENEVWADGPDAGHPTEPGAWPSPVDVEHDLDGSRDGYQGAPVRVRLRDSSGGDPAEWPADLRVRQWPVMR